MLIIMQGASGSGKSTKAKELAVEHNALVYSTDDLFIVDGVYVFNPKLLGVNHKKNLDRTIEALKAGQSIVVDNTNTQAWECKGYVEAALELGAEIRFHRCTGNYQNIHGVPSYKVQQMRERLEDLTVESVMASKKPF